MALGKVRQPVLLFLGDSITHFFGGEPAVARLRGPEVLDRYYGPGKALNLGYGWDQTENVLWRLPLSKILLLGIFPRGANPEEPRAKVMAVNERIASLDGNNAVTYLDIGKVFLEPNGSIAPEIMNDYLHPTATG